MDGRFSRKGFLAAAVTALLVGACSATSVNSALAGSTEPIQEAGYVMIGGIEQWVTITGADRSNPVVLFLHGGPGLAGSPFAASTIPGWEQDFTLVQWDQRGAGRTYGRNIDDAEALGPTLTLEQITADGIEVAEYLREHLGQDKIIITGGSWGSAVGISMAHARPDLFHAYVGLSQVTSMRGDRAAAYVRLRELAAAKGDTETLEALDAVGPPPWNSTEESRPFRQAQLAYQVELTTAPGLAFALATEYETDMAVWREAAEYSDRYFFGPTLSGSVMRVDVTGLTDFEIPIFIIHGEWDLTIPIERIRAYFETIRAPRKEFYVVPGAAHEPSATMVELQRSVLLTEVLPNIR